MNKAQLKENVLRVANDIFFKEVKEYLTEGKDVLFTINGNSMRPFLAHGDKVLITPAQKKDHTYGRIILAKSAFGYVLHRLVWKSKDKVWLAGDNNLVQLEGVEKGEILGSVKYAVVSGRRVDVHRLDQLFLALGWFLLRPFRLIVFKLKGIF